MYIILEKRAIIDYTCLLSPKKEFKRFFFFLIYTKPTETKTSDNI